MKRLLILLPFFLSSIMASEGRDYHIRTILVRAVDSSMVIPMHYDHSIHPIKCQIAKCRHYVYYIEYLTDDTLIALCRKHKKLKDDLQFDIDDLFIS